MVPRSLDGILSGKADEFVNILDHKEAIENTLSFTVSNVCVYTLTSHWSLTKVMSTPMWWAIGFILT